MDCGSLLKVISDPDLVLKIMMGLIALLGACIAWWQYQTASYRVKLDLFDRRYRVYRGLMDFLAAAVRDENISHEVLNRFYTETDCKRFLFGNDIIEYLSAVRKNVVKLRHLRIRVAHPDISEKERDNTTDKEGELISWLEEQITEAEKRFGKYMSLKSL